MATVTKTEAAKVIKIDPDKPDKPDGEEVLVYVAPSQQNAQRPVAKPGEPVLPGTVPTPAPQDIMRMVSGKLRKPTVT